MHFASGISGAINAQNAADAACQQVAEQLAGAPCELACVFVSSLYRASWPAVLERIHGRLAPKVLIGCSGSGVIGGGQELEWVPGLSIVGARLPGVQLFPFAVTPDELEQAGPGGFWIDKVGAAPDARPVFIVLADPDSCDPLKFLEELNATYRRCPVIGGLVSGGDSAAERLLFRDRGVSHEGVVGVAMAGNVVMETVISQGCRPIGRPYVVTHADDGVVRQLGGRQALAVLHEVLSGLSPDDRELAQRGSVFVGVAISEMKPSFAAGDFLIRNIVGLDPESGALAVADQVSVGQTLQFQLRDPGTSRQELRRLLQHVTPPRQPAPPMGGLLFNCTGRGKSLYGTAHQDVRIVQAAGGKLPVGGCFCSGEIGPIGDRNLLHGYTASLGLFRPLQLPARREELPQSSPHTT